MKNIEEFLKILRDKKKKDLDQAVGETTSDFLLGKTIVSDPNLVVSKPVQDVINKNAISIQQGAEPPEATNNILTPDVLEKIEQVHAAIRGALSSEQTLTEEVLELIESTFADIQKLANPSEKILTKDTLKVINQNASKIMEGYHPPQGEDNVLNQDTLNKIDQNYNQIQNTAHPPEAEDNILTSDTKGTIQKNWSEISRMENPPEGFNNILTLQTVDLIKQTYKQIQRLADPPEGTNNILTEETVDIIESNFALIQRLANPPEGTNNILTTDTLALIEQNYAQIQKLAEPPEGTNNILVTETLALIEKTYAEIIRNAHPPEGINNILVDGKIQSGFESINTQSRIDENWKEIEKGREPDEGTNNILVDKKIQSGFESIDTLSVIDKNWQQVQTLTEPPEGTDNILVSGEEMSGFETIDTLNTIDENWKEIEKGREPDEGTNNILVDGKEQKGFESIDTLSVIDENWKEIEKGREPDEGTNNILVDGKTQAGFESIDTLKTIDKNWSEIEKGREPEEGTNNILVDGKTQVGFESINTRSIIDKNWSEIEKGREPEEGTNNILVDGKEQQGFESINTRSIIDKNWSEIEKGREPEEGTNNILVDGKQQKGFESIDTKSTIDENWKEIQKGKEPTQGTDNILVDGKEQKGFEFINTQTRIDENWSEIEKGKEPTQGTDNILVDGRDQKGFEVINTIKKINDNFSEIEKGQEPSQGVDNILVDRKEQRGFESINTLSRIEENWSQIEFGKEPTQGTDNILVDGLERSGFDQIDTLSRIEDNWSRIELGKEPLQGTDNILVDSVNQSGFEQINTLSRIEDNWSQIERGKEPTQGTDNILVDGLERSGFDQIDTLSRIEDNWSQIETGKDPSQGTDNILVGLKNQSGFEQIDTLGRIDKNWQTIEKGIDPPQGRDNIANNDATSLRSDLRRDGFKDVINYYEKIDEQLGSLADRGNYWNYTNVMPRDNSHLLFDGPNVYRFNKDTFRYRAFLSTGNTVLGDFNESSLQVTYLSSHHGMYDDTRDQGSIKENIKGRVFGKDEKDQLLFNRPFSIGSFDRESLILEKMKTMGYYLDYDRGINRVSNIETQYSVVSTFEKGKPTGFDETGDSKYRNYFVADRADFGNEYGRIRYSLDPLAFAKKTSFAAEQFDAQSLLYPHMDSNGLFYLPPVSVPLNQSANDFRIYENSPIPTSDDITYATDPISNINRENRIRQVLRIKRMMQEQIGQLNKFGESQHDFFEYSGNYMDVPSMTWLSQDIRVEDFRYYEINKDMAGAANPAGYGFENSNRYEGTDGMRRQIDYFRNNPDISFGLENMRLMYLANPRNAQIFDPISMFWHPEQGKTGAVDSRKDLRLTGGPPMDYYGYHRQGGLVAGIANASGGKFGEQLNRLAPFIETGFDIITGGAEEYTKRIYGGDGIVWAELGNYGQLNITNINNLMGRSADIAAQFINPSAFSIFSEVDRYLNGFNASIVTNGTPEVFLKAKLGLNLGQIAGMEFRVMRGRNTLTSGQRLAGDGPITLNDAMEFIQNIAGNKIDNLDWIDGGSSYHEYMTDPRVWNADQRLIWNNLGGRLLNAPEKPSEDGGGFTIDPIQIGKNILKTVGINLDDPFSAGTDQQLMQAFKDVVTKDDIQYTIDLQEMKRKAVQQTSPDGEGGIYQNEGTKTYSQNRTAMSTRPDWFREVLYNDMMHIKGIQKKVSVLREYGLETNFNPTKFNKWNTEYNDGNVQYVYDKNSSNSDVSSEKAGKEILFDYHDYIGTVKVASPNMDEIIKRQRMEIERSQSLKEKSTEFEGKKYRFVVNSSFPSISTEPIAPPGSLTQSEKDFHQQRVLDLLTQFGTVSPKDIDSRSTQFIVITDTDPKTFYQNVQGQLASDPLYGASRGCQHVMTDISSIQQEQENISKANKDDAAKADAEIEKRGGVKPVSFERINNLLNNIDPQIFRFWIRTISRTHYEVTPEVFYLDDNNKVSLARPRYTGHSAVFFDSILKSMSENINPSWNSQSFFGRTEDVHTWQSTNRTLQFSTAFVVSSPSQLPSLRAKVQELIRMCYPQIQAIRSVGVLAFRAGPIIELAIGDMFRTFGYITSMSINWGVNGEPVWELSKAGQMVKGVELNLDIQILHKELPHAGTEFYAQSFKPSIFYHKGSDVEKGMGFKTTGSYIQGSNNAPSGRAKASSVPASSSNPVASNDGGDAPAGPPPQA